VAGAVLVSGIGASAQTTGGVTGARSRLTAATAVREQAERRVARLTGDRERLRRRLAASSLEVDALARQIADARREARDRAIDAYIANRGAGQLAVVLGSDDATEMSARSAYLADRTGAAADAAEALARIEQQNDPAVVALGKAVDDVERELAAALDALTQAAALEADAERELADAVAAEQAAAAVRARVRPPTTTTTVRPRTRPAARPMRTSEAEAWARLVECESGGDYTVVSATGRYRGAYQFDQRTWESVGGVGDPAAAPPAEQDLRAHLLYEQRGARAWPNCGIHLLRAG